MECYFDLLAAKLVGGHILDPRRIHHNFLYFLARQVRHWSRGSIMAGECLRNHLSWTGSCKSNTSMFSAFLSLGGSEVY